MKACIYCHAIMHSEYETNAHDIHRYKGYFIIVLNAVQFAMRM